MTYSGGLFISCCVLRWYMVGIAHGEESVDGAPVLVAGAESTIECLSKTTGKMRQ